MKHSKNELLSCIYDCIDESLPSDWDYSHVQLTIEGNSLNTKFSYVRKGEKETISFTPNNIVAPTNALFFLYEHEINENNMEKKNTITIKLHCDGKYHII